MYAKSKTKSYFIFSRALSSISHMVFSFPRNRKQENLQPSESHYSISSILWANLSKKNGLISNSKREQCKKKIHGTQRIDLTRMWFAVNTVGLGQNESMKFWENGHHRVRMVRTLRGEGVEERKM